MKGKALEERIARFQSRITVKQARRDEAMARVEASIDQFEGLRGLTPGKIKKALLKIRKQDARDFPLIRKLDDDLLSLKYRLAELKAEKELKGEGIHVV